MIDAEITQPWPREVSEAVSRFKQGDLIERPPFIYVAKRDYGVWEVTKQSDDLTLDSDVFEVDASDGPPYGLITTQTCDLNEQSRKPKQPWFMVAPVYRADDLLDPSQVGLVRRDRIGHLIPLDPPELQPGLWVADLRIEIPFEKSWLVGRTPIQAFDAEDAYFRLADRLARRRDRPALANVISNEIVGSLRRRLDRGSGNDLGNRIRELRLFVDGPRMNPLSAQLLIIPKSGELSESDKEWFEEWWDDAQQICHDQGLELAGNRYETLESLSAADYVSSVPLDFSHLSPYEDYS